MQSPGYSPECSHAHPEMLKTSATLLLNASQALMLSFRHFDVSCHHHPHRHRQNESAVTAHMLTKSGHEQLLWRRCGTLPPLPEVVVQAEGVRIEMRTAQHDRSYGARFKKFDVCISHTQLILYLGLVAAYYSWLI